MIERLLVFLGLKQPTKPGHLPPTYGVRKVSWSSGISHCRKCDIAGHYQSGLSQHDPCPMCGGKMIERVARWDKTQWVFKTDSKNTNCM